MTTAPAPEPEPGPTDSSISPGNAPAPARLSLRERLFSLVRRLAILVFIALAVGWLLNWIAAGVHKEGAAPAGFAQGMAQGALMPMALPHLLLGQDIQIYSSNNAGIPYKLGYTAGVNLAGAIFFGFLFWRLHRWTRTRG